MKSKTKNLSFLIENQLPDFIISEYPKFSAFMQKYYEYLELPGNPIDLISNITDYRNVDTYTSNILNQNTILTQNIDGNSIIINAENTSSFPSNNGYILIGDEVIFYKEKTQTSFINCYRNISSTTKIGDIYSSLEFNSVENNEVSVGKQHLTGELISNISHLFLYSLIKNFENEYLSSFPEKSLKITADKSLLLKNIKKFYSSKGTESSIKFLFNSLIPSDLPNEPTVHYPKDSTYKSSDGEWVSNYSLKIKIIGNISDIKYLIGAKITQLQDQDDPSINYASAIIDNIIQIGEEYYEIILSRQTIVGEFSVISETYLTSSVLSTFNENKRINVYSTTGWNTNYGYILIGSEKIKYKSKTVNQFIIDSRGANPGTYFSNTAVYSKSNVNVSYVDELGVNKSNTILILGILYGLNQNEMSPYSLPGDVIEVSPSGFDTKNSIIFRKQTNSIRWLLNETNATSSISSLSDVLLNVSAIYEDDQYYYIASSGFPSYAFGVPSWNINFTDQKNLKIIRKLTSKSTEIYQTPIKDIGILVNGVTIRGAKDEEKIIFGKITNITVTKGGSGYINPPNILIIDSSGISVVAKAEAILSGNTVDKINVISSGEGFFPPLPNIVITSGRNAVVEPIITNGNITSLKIINQGEYYTTPPKIIIKDSSGKGRFANFDAIISEEGKLTGYIKKDEGKSYELNSTTIEIQSVGFGAEASSVVTSWTKNRFEKLKNNLDNNYGYYFINNNQSLGYGYSHVANPKALRIYLNDNIDSLGNISNTLSHSPILGFAYDGNPIYGPYGYSDSTNSQSSISRIRSSYILKNTRDGGPSISVYPLGTFLEDYKYNHLYGDLDENNGRFCVTPDYPDGTYAYFTTINANNTPAYPYFIGNNYYSTPVDSNYNKTISQDDLPKTVFRLRTDKTNNNGDGVVAYVETVNSGSVSGVSVFSSTSNFSTDSTIAVDYVGSTKSDILAKVSEIKGKSVNSLISSSGNYGDFNYFNPPENPRLLSPTNPNKCIKITTEFPCYLYDGDILTQEGSLATGKIVGNVFDQNNIVLKEATNNFNTINTISSSTQVINLIVNKISSYTINSEITLTNGKQALVLSVSSNKLNCASHSFTNNEIVVFSSSFSQIIVNQQYYVVNALPTSFQISNTIGGPPIFITSIVTPGSIAISQKAKGILLESTDNKNTCKVRVIQGNFNVDNAYFIKTNNINDTTGSKIIQIIPLSYNIKILNKTDKIAILKTNEEHDVFVGDAVNVDIIPNDQNTTTTIYVRKKIYQKVRVSNPVYNKQIIDTGIGRIELLNSGNEYAYNTSGNAILTNIELIFANPDKCRGNDGQIVSNLSDSVIGNIGNLNNARATLRVTNGVITSVTITSKGKLYKKGDILTVSPTAAYRNPTAISIKFLLIEVDHVGFAAKNTTLFLNNVVSISVNDYLKINSEIVKVVNINNSENSVVVLRAQKQSSALDHISGNIVSAESPSYMLSSGYQIGYTSNSPIVSFYDSITNELTVTFNPQNTISSINSLLINSFFYDQNTPPKTINVVDIIDIPSYKFEFSYDNISWTKNPIIPIQKYYKYKFDTSHSSLSGHFLEFSPSGNYNILTEEVTKSISTPGNPNSYVIVKFGFGFAISTNQYTEKKNIDFSNYFYFDKSGIIDSEKSYLKLVEDPLQGEHIVVYKTPNEIVYTFEKYPVSTISGNIKYSTNSSSAFGEISKVNIINSGKNISVLPIVDGVVPHSKNECNVDAIINDNTGSIIKVNILNKGYNYSKPKAIVIDENGSGAVIKVYKNSDSSISSVVVVNGGTGFSKNLKIKIIETDVKLYFSSSSIGIPEKISIIQNGKGFNNDYTTKRKITTNRILVLKDFDSDAFFENELVEQFEESVVIARGYVSKNGWKSGNNILKLIRVDGEFKNNVQIKGKTQQKTAVVVNSFVSNFDYSVKSYSDNMGYFISDKSKLSTSSQKLTDSYFYQDYSYVIKSRTPINEWRNLVKYSTHPAGFKMFGEVLIESSENVRINPIQQNLDRISIIQLWDPSKNVISVENTYRTITQLVAKSSFVDELRGFGSLFVNSFDDTETISYDIYLTPEFNGYFDNGGNRVGNKIFEVKIIGSNTAAFIPKKENLIISIDGILQQPGDAFTVSNTEIIFKEAPLGYRDTLGNSITVSQYKEGVDTKKQKFIGKLIRFKDINVNQTQFFKIKDISNQFNGIKTNFQLLNSENNNFIELESNSNLLVSIDGILQNPGITPLFPSNRSYYIKRTTVPNEIVFNEPPKENQKFNAYSISNYELAEIDMNLVDGISFGPYIMRAKFSKKSLEVFNDNNIFVFIDGILQKKIKDYSTQGSSIVFTTQIKQTQKILILYYYGKSVNSTITAFNYEKDIYFNKIIIDLNYIPPISQYSDKICYQGQDIINYTAIGKAKGIFATNFGSKLIIEAQNGQFNTNLPITIIDGLASGLGDLIIDQTSIISVSPFETDAETNGILQKTNTGWLIGSSLGRDTSAFINMGDFIRVDGETNYRKIISIPDKVYKTQYNSNISISNNFFGRLTVTPNEEIGKGEGLFVSAKIQNGKVIELFWNDKKYNQYGIGKLQPGAYGYKNAPLLVFVSQPLLDDGGNIISNAQGGGATGFVIVSGEEVIDVVLTNSGDGYLTPPKIYITKGFDIIKNPEKKVRTKIELGYSPQIKTTLLISSSADILYEFSVKDPRYGISVVPTALLELSTQITQEISTILPIDNGISFSATIDLITEYSILQSISFPEDPINIEIILYAHTEWSDLIPTTIEKVAGEISKNISTGFGDIYAYTDLSASTYSPITLGSTLAKFESGAFNDMGVVNIGGISLDQFDRTYGDITIEDFELRPNSAKAVVEETLMNLGYGSTNEYGAFLDSSLSVESVGGYDNITSFFGQNNLVLISGVYTITVNVALNGIVTLVSADPGAPSGLYITPGGTRFIYNLADTIVYIPNTSRFPSAGKLLIGNEIVTYTSKLSDRFTGVTRGYLGSPISIHSAGDYLRTMS